VRRTPVVRLLLSILLVAVFDSFSNAQVLQSGLASTLDPALQARLLFITGHTRVLVRAASLSELSSVTSLIRVLGGTKVRTLGLITAVAADVPNLAIETLAAAPGVAHISLDRLIGGADERTDATIGSADVRRDYGYDGSGVTVATIDSGITAWHDDLADASGATERVDWFVDFINGRTIPYDDYGHGTHVAGIIAGNGADSSGQRSGIAPGAHIVALKVLDANGHGRTSDVIAAFDYIASHPELRVRVVNLSVAAPVYESYTIDPLTIAARRLVDAGVVVVAAAGNAGRGHNGHTAYGSITAPGNAPWVLTVGASSHMGTVDRSDDTMAAFSSRGPTAIDAAAKPDVVAPGVGIESLTDPASTLYASMSPYLLAGTLTRPYFPYLSLSGTSMATPVVSGTIALMLQANPSLTPNAVKAILEYTSQVYAPYDRLSQGAGFLNAKGAVDAARAFASPDGIASRSDDWSGQIIWGDRIYSSETIAASAQGFARAVTWGQTLWLEPGWTAGPNVVWGSTCGGADCGLAWTIALGGDSTVATSDDETVVWGTSDDDDTVVWGTSCSDPSCAPVVWQP